MLNIEDIKKAIADAAKEYGAEGYELTISNETSAGAETLKDEISTVSYSRSGGMTVRCVKGGKSGYATSELVSPEEAADLVRRACDSALVVDDVDEVPLFEGSKEYHKVEKEEVVLPSADEMKEDALSLQKKTYAASDKIVDGTQCFTGCSASESAFLNSAGLSLTYESSIVYHGVYAAVKDGEEASEEYKMAIIGKEEADETVKKAVDGALSMLGAKPVESGKYNIILDHSTMRSLLGVYSSVFSARNAFLKTTLLADKEGEKIASDILTICDDPFHPEKFGKCPFDGEGIAVYKKNVIENGVLKTLLYNRMYAKKLGKETTGNASGAKGVSPKGLYIEPGKYTSEGLLTKLGNGLYITELKGLHAGANTQSGDFSLEAAGFLVENGEKVRPVKNITVADNFYSLLKKVEAISDKVDFGTTGSVGAPEVMFSDISVAGK